MPSKTIVDFANQVKSYALGIKDQQVLGAWNELNNKATTSSISPATFTVNADKSVSVAVSSTPSGNVIFNLDDNATIKAGTRYLSGCPDIDSDDVFIQIYKSGVIDVKNKRGTEQEFTVASDITGATIRIVIGSGVSADKVDGKVFKPMISLEPNQPYVPYAMTNQELSEVKVVNASYTGASSTIKDISLDVQRVGKVVQFAIYFVTNTSINAGATTELTLVNCPLPSYSGVRIIGFSGTYELIGWVESTGKVKIRFFGNTNANSSIVLTGTYLTND